MYYQESVSFTCDSCPAGALGARLGAGADRRLTPPQVNAVGLIAGIAPLIGCVAACLIAGPLTDYSARFLAVRNHGKPSSRLLSSRLLVQRT